MARGRYTSYDADILAKAEEYLDCFLDECSEVVLTPPQVVPTRVGLSIYIKRCTSTIDAWEKDPNKSEFMGVLKDIKATQHAIALNGGMTGDYNAPIVKLLLTKHGYHDKVEQDVKSSDGSMTPKTIDDFYKN